MKNDDMTKPSQQGETELATEASRSEQRQRLAQQIGRLLADTWLKRQREEETDEMRGDDVSPEDRAN